MTIVGIVFIVLAYIVAMGTGMAMQRDDKRTMILGIVLFLLLAIAGELLTR